MSSGNSRFGKTEDTLHKGNLWSPRQVTWNYSQWSCIKVNYARVKGGICLDNQKAWWSYGGSWQHDDSNEERLRKIDWVSRSHDENSSN